MFITFVLNGLAIGNATLPAKRISSLLCTAGSCCLTVDASAALFDVTVTGAVTTCSALTPLGWTVVNDADPDGDCNSTLIPHAAPIPKAMATAKRLYLFNLFELLDCDVY